MELRTDHQPSVLGFAEIRPEGRRGFPRFLLRQSGVTLASLGNWSWFAIYLGRGQRIELPDGARWRLGAVNEGRAMCPALRDRDRRLLAMASPIGEREAGIATKDASFTLYPIDASSWRSRAKRWRIAAWGQDIGELTRRPHTIITERRVPLAGVLVAFAVAELGIPGASELGVPRFQWRAG